MTQPETYTKKYLKHNSVPKEMGDAYLHLAKTYLDYNQKLPADERGEGADLDKTVSHLFRGLTQYFKEADNIQEELIRRSVNAAREVLLCDTLLVALDAEKDIKDKNDLRMHVESVLTKVFGKSAAYIANGDNPCPAILLEKGVEGLPEVSDEELKQWARKIGFLEERLPDFVNTLRDNDSRTQEKLLDAHSTRHANKALNDALTEEIVSIIKRTAGKDTTDVEAAREELKEKIKDIFKKLPLPEIHSDPEGIQNFRQFRKNQTTAINRYDHAISETLEKIERIVENPEITKMGDTNVQTDLVNIQEFAINLMLRREKLEEFRNGLVDALEPQPAELNALSLKSTEVARALGLGEKENPAIGVKDVEEIYQSLKEPIHPLIFLISSFQNNLKILTGTANNPNYHSNPPGVSFRENGVKSWRRTIEKLVWDKAGNWSGMTDLSRIGIVCNRAESMYHYADAFRRFSGQNAAQPLNKTFAAGWKIDGPAADSKYRDRGVVFTATGAMNWLINPSIPVKGEKVFPWACEVKLEDAQQSKFELVTHKLYECTRLLEDDNREVNIKALTPEKFNHFLAESQKNLGLLLRLDILDKNPTNLPVYNALGRVLRLSQHIYPADDKMGREQYTNAELLRKLLTEAHYIVCAHAAKQSSPSMQALYAHHAELTKNTSSVLAPDEIESVLQDYGPQLKSDINPKGYEERHKKIAEQLVERHIEGFKAHGGVQL